MEETLFAKLEEIVTEVKSDVEKFYEKGNKSAGTRIRKSMQEVKKLAQEIRKEVQEKKNA